MLHGYIFDHLLLIVEIVLMYIQVIMLQMYIGNLDYQW